MDNKLGADLIIFDLDGTLIDSSEDIAWAANRTLVAFGQRERPVVSIKEHIGWGVKPLLEKLLPEAAPEMIAEAREKFLEFYGTHLMVDTVMYPGVEQTLRHFSARGKLLSIITNKPVGLTLRILDELKISDLFRMVLGGDSLQNKKPHPEPVEKTFKGLGIDPSRTVIVGDSPVDCEAGRAAGTMTIGVSYGFRGKAELQEAGCSIIIDSFPELKGCLA